MGMMLRYYCLIIWSGLVMLHRGCCTAIITEEDLHLPLNSDKIDKTVTTYNSHWKKRDVTPYGFHTISGNGSVFSHPGKRGRMLGMILAFDKGHMQSLRAVLSQYSRMCEDGWDVNIVLASSTAAIWTKNDFDFLKKHGHCFRQGGPIGIQIEQHPKALNIKVAEKHRLTLKREMNKYDVFVYQEDDIVISKEAFEAYLAEVDEIEKLLGSKGLEEYAPGFLRFRVNDLEEYTPKSDVKKQLGAKLPSDFGKDDPGYGSWRFEMSQAWAEELPLQEPLCLPLKPPKDETGVLVEQKPYIRLDGNVHQAAFVFTRQQVTLLENKCEFTGHRMWNLGDQYGREYMSSFSLYWSFLFRQKTIPSCRLKKVMPAPLKSALPNFGVLHYYKQKHYTAVSMKEYASQVDEYEKRIKRQQERGAQVQEDVVRQCFVPEQETFNYPQPLITEIHELLGGPKSDDETNNN